MWPVHKGRYTQGMEGEYSATHSKSEDQPILSVTA